MEKNIEQDDLAQRKTACNTKKKSSKKNSCHPPSKIKLCVPYGSERLAILSHHLLECKFSFNNRQLYINITRAINFQLALSYLSGFPGPYVTLYMSGWWGWG